ncbi:MAG: signal peptide peptidase SppA [Candidatus Alcyoniella australis]|nr:signal peptide peptidase SppA [Candidatus Alcyoniella australis]
MRKRPILFGFIITSIVLVIFGSMLVLSLWMLRGLRGESSLFNLGDSVAIIEIRGVILDSRGVIEQLRKYDDDGGIKAIILRIESPGGTVGPSQEIYQEVMRIRNQGNEDGKPVVASMGSVAASGGYYIAAAADRIVANPGTITGSIGVVMEFLNYEGVYEWAGLKSNVIKTGRFKDIGSPTREMSQDERDLLQTMIESVLDQFVGAIVEGRSMDQSLVRENADGRVFSGQQALELGFVDELGNLQVAIDLAAQLAGIEDEPNVIYPPRRQQRGLFYMLFRGAADAFFDAAAQHDTGDLKLLYCQ